MAPRRKSVSKSPEKGQNLKLIDNGKIKKAPKTKRISTMAKTEILKEKKNVTETKSKNIANADVYISFEICNSCTTYKRNAKKIFEEIQKQFKDKTFELLINDNGKPRRGSFELIIATDKKKNKNGKLIWTGIEKGPPRRLKFPEPEHIVELVSKTL